MKKILSFVLIVAMVAVFMMGCSNGNKGTNDNGKPNVVTTTTLIADLVRSIGGDHVNVKELMGLGVDPHLYKASAGDVRLLQEANMVVYNGLHLEGKMGDVFEQIEGSDKLIFAVSEDIDEKNFVDFVTNPGNFDPHIWFDVSLWRQAAIRVSKGLIELDKSHTQDFDRNLQAYLDELSELERYIKGRVVELPVKERILITAHDAFNYFGKAYDFEVRGLQGISTASEAGTSDVRDLANYIVSNKIKAIFVESSVPRKSIEALQEAVKAQGFDVKIGGELYSDSTGGEGSGAETYIKTFKANIDTIIDGLK